MGRCCCPAFAGFSERNAPPEYYRCFCSQYPITTLAFPVAIISGVASIFFMLIYVTIFEWTTVIYVLIGIFVYWALYIGIFHQRYTMLLPYIVFEALSVMGYIVLLVFLFLALMPYPEDSERKHATTTTTEAPKDVIYIGITVVILLIFVTLLGIVIKVWALSVILTLYRYLHYKQLYGNITCAHYINGGVQINAGSEIFPPVPPTYEESRSPNHRWETFSGVDYPPLPTYDNLINAEKPGNNAVV